MNKEKINLKRGEFIGKNVEASNGLTGTIIDETKELFVLNTKKGRKTLKKSDYLFVFKIKGEKIEIDGKEIAKRPEDRIKIKS